MAYQTRSYENGLNDHKTLLEAHDAWEKDQDIWKISWGWNDVYYRMRPKLKKEKWSPLSEQKLCSLSAKYAKAGPNDLFWVNQTLIAPNLSELIQKRKSGEMNKEEFEIAIAVNSILSVCTDDEFKKYYINRDEM
jgi:hypothetical protein